MAPCSRNGRTDTISSSLQIYPTSNAWNEGLWAMSKKKDAKAAEALFQFAVAKGIAK